MPNIDKNCTKVAPKGEFKAMDGETIQKGCGKILNGVYKLNNSQQRIKVTPKAITKPLNSGAQDLVISAKDTKTADTIKKEIEEEILRLKEIIVSFKNDIKKNAEKNYDAYTHSNLIKSIEIAEYRIKELKSELKGFLAGQNSVINGDTLFLKGMLKREFEKGQNSQKEKIQKLTNKLANCVTIESANQSLLNQKKEILEKVKQVMYGRIDWIKVFKDAYEGRKTSWYELGHIREWRNATDEVLFAVWKQLEKKLQQEIKPQG